VWGKGENGDEVLVAWISGLVDVQKKEFCMEKCHYIQLQLDSKWLEFANANLVLMSVSLKELKGYITLTTADSIKVISDNMLINWTPFLKAEDIEIGWEIKEGYNPYLYKVNNASSDTGKLVLLHGYRYCVGKKSFHI